MSHLTIARDTQQEIVIEKSRFICTLKKVTTEVEAQDFVKDMKKRYWDATHNCSAYLVSSLVQRSSDDGEPGGTAGLPMLEVLRKNKLTGVAAVVTRYFGGVKLGAGGLVRAYTNAVTAALQAAGRVRRIELGHYVLSVPAVDAGKVLNLLYADGGCRLGGVAYGADSVQIEFLLQQEEVPAATEALRDLLQLPVELVFTVSEPAEVEI